MIAVAVNMEIFRAAIALLLMMMNPFVAGAEIVEGPAFALPIARENSSRLELTEPGCRHIPRVTVSLRRRGRVTLKCGLGGFRHDAVQWLLPNGKPLEASLGVGHTNDKLEVLRNGNLRINRIKVADGGLYTCRLRSKMRNAGQAPPVGRALCTTTEVRITDKAKVRKLFTVRTLTLGNTATLDCYTPGLLDALSRHWRKDGHVVRRLPGGAVKTFSANGKLLTLHGVAWSDAGVYRCLAINGSRRAVRQIAVKVVDVQPDYPPRLTSPPISHYVRLGHPTELQCTFKAKGLLQIRWKFCRHSISGNDVALPKHRQCKLVDRTRYEPVDGQVRAVTDVKRMESVSLADEGYYICIATNTLGADKATASVAVI